MGSELPAYGENAALQNELDEEEIDWSDLTDRQVTAATGDKIGGWPAWVQTPSYPSCPECHQPMRYVMQLESDGLSGHIFGDRGKAHLFQCADHAEGVAFSWQTR